VAEGRSADRRGPSLPYLPALDGIRGVSIIVIMGYHAGVFLTSGGYYSLDTFFALSGFLTTTLLIAEWQRSGSIRVVAVWGRRARRLLPALLLVLPAVAAYAEFLVRTQPPAHGVGRPVVLALGVPGLQVRKVARLRR
jgi:peptidoglycan/LPS O-acetylase OafA/YrhL